MDYKMNVKEKIHNILMNLPVEQVQVRLINQFSHRVVALVVSPTFEGMDESHRQSIVWNELLQQLPSQDQYWVEYVFTKTPTEAARDLSALQAQPSLSID